MNLRSGLALAAAVMLVGCAGQSGAGDVRQVVSTTSFGMCMGYCKTRLELSQSGAVLVREPWGRGAASGLPVQRIEAPLSAPEWGEIARLAADARIDGLAETLGCPDCADGGAESLTIVDGDGAKTITFDFGAAIAEAQPLLDRVRAIREKMTPTE